MFFLLRLDGWNVLFIIVVFNFFRGAKVQHFSEMNKEKTIFFFEGEKGWKIVDKKVGKSVGGSEKIVIFARLKSLYGKQEILHRNLWLSDECGRQ